MVERIEYRPGLGVLVRKVPVPRASILFFHGGGWYLGEADTLVSYWEHLSPDLICGSAEYRVTARHNSTVYHSIDDAGMASLCFRKQFPACPLFLAGASSGGTSALFASRRVTTAGLILFNPVLDLSAQGFRSQATPPHGDESISPLHLVRAGEKFPPILLIQGENDTTTPAATAREFYDAVASMGGEIKLQCYPGKQHGFFKYGEDAPRTAALVEDFIIDIVSRNRE